MWRKVAPVPAGLGGGMELGEPPGRDDGDCRAKARSRGQCIYRLHRVRCAGAQPFRFLRLVLPDLKEVVACSRSAASAERFVAMVRGAGLVARTTLEPREAIEGLDVIITTVPEG